MSKPVPRNVSGGQLLLTGSNVGLSDVRVLCEVNTSGSVRALRVGSGNRHRISEYRRMFRLLRFYPALDYSGDPVRFTGPIHLASDNSGIVRVDFLWLPADGLLYSPQVIEQ